MAEKTGFEEFCNLSEEELRERSLTLRRDLLVHVKASQRLPGGVALAFDDTPELKSQLEQLVAFERQCCSGLDWTLDRTPDGDRLELTVDGLAADAPALESLGSLGLAAPTTEPSTGSACCAPEQKPEGGAARFARAGGLGVAAAFFLFCVVPIGIAAAGGTALAAWLSPLDHPLVVVLGGAALAIPAWRFLHRRERHA